MPKGIYPRASKGGMRTAVVEAPVTPETANAQTVQVVSQSGDDNEMSTTQRLFGDLTNQEIEAELRKADGSVPVSQNPLIEEEGEPVEQKLEAKPEVKPEPEAQIPQPPVQDDSFDIEKVLNKKVKTKIDGKEEEVTLKDLRDNYQINKHLAQAADKVGEERRKLAEERRQLQELRQHQPQGIPVQTQPEYQSTANQQQPVPQEFQPLYAKIQSLENQLSQFVQGTQPVLFESNRQRVSNELKSQGFDDFLNYIPKMESHIVSLSDPELVRFYDTPAGAKALYFQLKAQDLNQRPAPTPSAPVRVNAPVEPPAIQIDSGSQPVGASNDDGTMNYRRAFRRATELGTDTPQGRDAWNQVLMQKGLIPGE